MPYDSTDIFYLFNLYWEDFKLLEEAMQELEQYEEETEREFRMQSHLRRLRRKVYVYSQATATAHETFHNAMATLFTQDNE